MSPTSATSAEATTRETPRIACSASTTGAMLQPGTRSRMRPVRRSTRASSSIDRVEVLLAGDLLSGMREGLVHQPFPVPPGPALGVVAPPVPEQEALEALPRLPERLHHVRPRPNEVAHGLVLRVRHPDRRQLTGPMQPRQRRRG